MNSEVKAIFINFAEIEIVGNRRQSIGSVTSSTSNDKQFFTRVGQYRGGLIAMKPLGTRTVNITNKQVWLYHIFTLYLMGV